MALAHRKQVQPGQRLRAGEALARNGRALLVRSDSDAEPGDGRPTVAAYVSMGTEVETRPMLRMLLDEGCRVLVPRLGAGLDIGWSELGDLDELRNVAPDDNPATPAGTSIPVDAIQAGEASSASPSTPAGTTPRCRHIRPQEPNTPTLGPDALAAADLIIVPALLVARDGIRLGRGGGWYDRALPHAKAEARIVAVCWPWEVVDGPLPRAPHDLPVDAALTPSGLVRLERRHCRRER